MSYSFEYIDIILLAMIAGFIFLRLRGILGKKTGFEENINSSFPHEEVPETKVPPVLNAETFDEVTVLAEKLMEEDSQSIKGDETESMRHAVRLAERAQQAIEEEKERLKQEEMAKLAAESESENPGDWLVE